MQWGKIRDFFPVAKLTFTTEHFADADKMFDHSVHVHDMILS